MSILNLQRFLEAFLFLFLLRIRTLILFLRCCSFSHVNRRTKVKVVDERFWTICDLVMDNPFGTPSPQFSLYPFGCFYVFFVLFDVQSVLLWRGKAVFTVFELYYWLWFWIWLLWNWAGSSGMSRPSSSCNLSLCCHLWGISQLMSPAWLI